MSRLRDQRGSALVIAIVVVATMAVLGTATLTIVNTQTDQTSKQRTGESTFNLAEATLNAQAFLLARDWPQAVNAASCSSTTMNGTLAMPAASVTLHDQVQRVLAQTYTGDPNVPTSQWWVTTCAEGGRDSWDASLLNGPSYDSATASTGPRRMWVRAEARVAGRKRAVVALVQAGQAPVFPNLALVTGMIGGDLGSTLTNLTDGPLVGSLLGALVNTNPMFVGNVGLRCSLLGASSGLLGCLSGVFALTSATPLGPLLQQNAYVHYGSDHIADADELAQLRRQAQQSGTYYATSSTGVGGVANNAACLPANSAGKVIFIEQIGNGTGTCILNTAANPSAKALIIGAGGGGVQVQGGGTFTGVINTLRGKALAGGVADVRISGGSRVSGGVFADDNSALGAAVHGQVQVIVPPPNLCAALGLLQLVCNLLGLNGLIGALGGLIGPLLPQISPYLPAITYNANVINAVTTFNDSAIVAGTFRQVAPMY